MEAANESRLLGERCGWTVFYSKVAEQVDSFQKWRALKLLLFTFATN